MAVPTLTHLTAILLTEEGKYPTVKTLGNKENTNPKNFPNEKSVGKNFPIEKKFFSFYTSASFR